MTASTALQLTITNFYVYPTYTDLVLHTLDRHGHAIEPWLYPPPPYSATSIVTVTAKANVQTVQLPDGRLWDPLEPGVQAMPIPQQFDSEMLLNFPTPEEALTAVNLIAGTVGYKGKLRGRTYSDLIYDCEARMVQVTDISTFMLDYNTQKKLRITWQPFTNWDHFG